MLATFAVYFYSNPRPQDFYDYTFRIAEAFLHGRLGLTEAPPSWLNEMVPFGGVYYSVFPLGSVLTVLPVALLKRAHLIKSFPAGTLAALVASAAALLTFLLSGRHGDSVSRRLLLAFSVVFGTWMWCNLAFAGAWQLALGFAVVGELGAIYFSLVRRRPVWAGFFFALAFGNRSEVVFTAPVFIYFLLRGAGVGDAVSVNKAGGSGESQGRRPGRPAQETRARTLAPSRGQLVTLSQFCLVPLALGLLTLAYNYARFSSAIDFGYARIPGVLQEPWYKHGIFSVRAIPLNAEKMIFEPWKRITQYPYLVPTGFGGSIFLSCPLLLLLFRRGARDKGAKAAAWLAIAGLTFILWLHGNPGGWQYSYRYAMILLPWMFLILLENGSAKLSKSEAALSLASMAVNGYATYLFLWTDYVRP
ncbi:MAG TPA: hypothetical protein VF736_04520 [Pyrinomonadaceae bacterium]